jgi:hypothetical protein
VPGGIGGCVIGRPAHTSFGPSLSSCHTIVLTFRLPSNHLIHQKNFVLMMGEWYVEAFCLSTNYVYYRVVVALSRILQFQHNPERLR